VLESTGVQPWAVGFVEDIHVSLNTCSPMQPRANTGSVSDEKSQNVQAHAGESKNLAGSLLYRMATDGEVSRSARPLLSVRHVAKILGVCRATVYRLCDRGELPHFRILNAIRVDIQDVKALLRRWRR
jgi:excisionase family DNA binding protein